MNYNIIVLSSINIATRAKRAVQKKGISIYLMRTPKLLSQKGCSYSLRFKSIHLNSVLETIKLFNIKIYGIYEETNSDKGKQYNLVR